MSLFDENGIPSLNPAFYGYRFVESLLMTDTIEDWSKVRSVPRATRRRCRGYRQNISHREVPKTCVFVNGDTIVGHPETIKTILAAVEKDGRSKCR